MTAPIYRVLAAGLAVTAACASSSRASAQQTNREKLAQVKSAFLLNFTKFVTWPEASFAGDTSPIVVGVLGDEYLGRILEEVVKDKHVHDRDLEVRQFSYDNPSDREAIKRVHVLYIANSERRRWGQIRSQLGRADVLVVGETDAFATEGGMIAFVISEGRVVFHMNRSAIERTKLKVSAKLYQLAPVVHTRTPW